MANLQKNINKCLRQIKTTPNLGVLCLIIIFGVIVRIWQIDTHAIFFGDAAHDVVTAYQAIQQKQLPLLGIESSVPRFRQGPIAVWLNMLSIILFGPHLLPLSILYVIIGCTALIVVYETITLAVNQKVAIAATALLAASPLAIAHSRMPYHITPIPLAMVFFLWSLYCLYHQKRWSHFGAGFAWGMLFQFELATTPLLLLLGYVAWKKKDTTSARHWLLTLSGILLALLPQVMYDLTHTFSHLGGFAVWTVYRIASFGTGRTHHLSFTTLSTVSQTFFTYISRIGVFDIFTLQVLFCIVVLISILSLTYIYFRRQVLPEYIEITLLSTWLLIVAYTVHGSPSEAYMPPFLILVPVLVGYWWSLQSAYVQKILLAGWLVVGIINIYGIRHNNWFVSSEHTFSYGPGSGEQQAAMEIIRTQYPLSYLGTTDSGGVFPKYLSNYRWWSIELHVPFTANASDAKRHVYIDRLPSALREYPNTTISTLQTIQVVTLYDQQY